jgi:hypothetical protein
VPIATAKPSRTIAVAHELLIAAHYIMTTADETYRELGGDYVIDRDDPTRRRGRLIAQLIKLGYDVELTRPRETRPQPSADRLAGLMAGHPDVPTHGT